MLYCCLFVIPYPEGPNPATPALDAVALNLTDLLYQEEAIPKIVLLPFKSAVDMEESI